MLSLDLALITYRPEGIHRVAQLLMPPTDGVRYVISWQQSQGAAIPAALRRPDVVVHRYEGVTQAGNRNNALAHCTADIVLNADDDLTYFPEGIAALRRTFDDHPELMVATFRAIHGNPGHYPENNVQLHRKLPKNYYASTFEIAFRNNITPALTFCPELGLNSPRFHGGEDEMFLMSAIRRGLDCRYFPITICAHAHDSTGTKSNPSAKNLAAAGVVIALTWPWTAVPRAILKAWRLRHGGKGSLPFLLSNIFRGVFAAPGVLKRNHRSLW